MLCYGERVALSRMVSLKFLRSSLSQSLAGEGGQQSFCAAVGVTQVSSLAWHARSYRKLCPLNLKTTVYVSKTHYEGVQRGEQVSQSIDVIYILGLRSPASSAVKAGMQNLDGEQSARSRGPQSSSGAPSWTGYAPNFGWD